jgi:hypothetical protein
MKDLQARSRFASGTDIALGSLLQRVLVAGAVAVSWHAHRYWQLGLFACVLIAAATLFAGTVLALWVIRRLRPLRPGAYRPNSPTRIAWNLMGFLQITNLVWDLLPVPLRSALDRYFCDPLAAWASDTYTVTASELVIGKAPTTSSSKDVLFKASAGKLSAKSVELPFELSLTAGQCLAAGNQPADGAPLLSLFEAIACP